MKIYIARVQKTEGMITKKVVHRTVITVETTPEEQETLKQAGVLKHVLMTHEQDDVERHILIDELWNSNGEPRPVTFRENDILTVRDKELRLRDSLVTVKEIIDIQIAHGDSSEEFYEL